MGSDDEPVDTEKFYKLLGIDKNATQQEIKKAYRKKAKTLHPDRHPDEHDKYHALFQEVQAAHEVLKDPEKRALYDKYGEKGAKRGKMGGGSSIFEQMFGGQRNGGNDSGGRKKSPTIKTALDCTLQDIYCGNTKKLSIQRRVANSKSSICPKCKGQGQITQVQRMGPMVLQQRKECPSCGGIGYRLSREEHSISVHVPVGGRHGENITIPGEGNKYPDMLEGDVVIQLRIAKHKLYNRKGADLGMNYSLSLRQALCGYKIRIPHVSGKELVITPYDPTEVVQPGSLKVVHTMGLPQRFSAHTKGHLYIVMEVKMPLFKQLNTAKIKHFEKILPIQEEEKEEKQQQTNKPQKKQKKKQKKKKQKGGVFGGLHGHFGDNKKGKNKQNEEMNVDEEEDIDDMIEEVECHSVDGNPKATPASASNYYQEDQDDGENVQCRQM